MKVNDLKPADILLFRGKRGSLISKAIKFLTNSKVSHAALVYESSEKLIEESLEGVRIFDIEQHPDRSNTIYVMRRISTEDSMQPVLDAAKIYLEESEPFALYNLFLLGMLLLYKKFTPDTPKKEAMCEIFRELAAGIIEYINEQKYRGKLPMVCSQFVYQCYEDAGGGYGLTIEDGVLSRAAISGAGELNMLDQAIYRFENDKSGEFRSFVEANAGIALRAEEPQSEEDLARELMKTFKRHKVVRTEGLDEKLALEIAKFGQAVYAATQVTSIKDEDLLNYLLNCIGKESPTGLSFLKEREAYFVAPGDLLPPHCINVEKVGKIKGKICFSI